MKTKPTVRTLLAAAIVGLVVGFAAVTVPACGGIKTNVSPVADVANAGGKVEDYAHVILTSAQYAQTAGIISRQALDDVALAVNKIGHVGLDLKAALDAYNAAKAAGSDLALQRAAVSQALAALSQALADVGQAVPSGTVSQIDQAAGNILGLIAQVKATVL